MGWKQARRAFWQLSAQTGQLRMAPRGDIFARGDIIAPAVDVRLEPRGPIYFDPYLHYVRQYIAPEYRRRAASASSVIRRELARQLMELASDWKPYSTYAAEELLALADEISPPR